MTMKIANQFYLMGTQAKELKKSPHVAEFITTSA